MSNAVIIVVAVVVGALSVGILFVLVGIRTATRVNAASSSMWRKRRADAEALRSDLERHVGQLAFCVSPLKPSGYISLEGEEFPALSDRDFCPSGSKVVVTGIDAGEGNMVHCRVRLVNHHEAEQDECPNATSEATDSTR